MSNIEAGFIGVVIGGILTIIASAVGSVITSELQMFNISAQKLRDAFVLVRTKINDRTITNPTELEAIFLAEFPKQQLAVTDFLFALNPEYHTDFNKAWKEYYEWPNCQTQPKESCFVQYTMPDDNGYISFASRELANKRIDAILLFSKRKTFWNLILK